MTRDVPVTELLGRIAKGDEDAYADLFNYYIEAARRHASLQISPSLQSSVSATSVAAIALRQSLELARTSRISVASRDEFYAALVAIVRCRTIDAVRKEERKKRGGGRTKEPVRDTTPGKQKGDVSGEATLNELAIMTVQNILREPTEIKRVICQLGILCGFSVSAIREAITPFCEQESDDSPRKKEAPSLSLIRLTLANRKKKILEELGREM